MIIFKTVFNKNCIFNTFNHLDKKKLIDAIINICLLIFIYYVCMNLFVKPFKKLKQSFNFFEFIMFLLI